LSRRAAQQPSQIAINKLDDGFDASSSTSPAATLDPLLFLGAPSWATAMQRLRSIADTGRTGGLRQQADTQIGGRRRHERRLCEGQQSSVLPRCRQAF
jgi:hypothetical protein